MILCKNFNLNSWRKIEKRNYLKITCIYSFIFFYFFIFLVISVINKVISLIVSVEEKNYLGSSIKTADV